VEVPNEVGELSQRVGSDRGFSAGEPSGGGAPGYPVGGDSGRRTTHFVGGGAHIRLEVRSLQRGRCRRRKKEQTGMTVAVAVLCILVEGQNGPEKVVDNGILTYFIIMYRCIDNTKLRI
jgi:hypothetical protein